jgi:hypothetical protein
MSDIHIGMTADGQDGATWLGRSLDDIKRNVETIDYGLTLGDITHNGDSESLRKYLSLRDGGVVPRCFELAGNHEHHDHGIRHYQALIRSRKPYCFVDGNIAWFFLSDETKWIPGNVSDRSYRWLKENIHRHEDKIIIVCSHQLPPNTIRRSNEDIFCLHPKRKIKELFSSMPIALSLCGHEHHKPYSRANMTRQDGTSYLNTASISHAYGTGTSASLILELEENSNRIVARRRNHDQQRYQKEFEYQIPLNQRIKLSQSSEYESQHVEKQGK